MEGRSYVPLLQGRCVGGSTVMNSAIAHRIPDDVLDEWSADFGLGDWVSAKRLEPHFEALENDLNVHAVSDEALGENNRLFLDEAASAGCPPAACTATRRVAAGRAGVSRAVPTPPSRE